MGKSAYIMVFTDALTEGGLRGTDLLLYSVIRGWTDTTEDKYCEASHKYLADTVGLSERGVREALYRLRDKGYIVIESRVSNKGQGWSRYRSIAPWQTEEPEQEPEVTQSNPETQQAGSSSQPEGRIAELSDQIQDLLRLWNSYAELPTERRSPVNWKRSEIEQARLCLESYSIDEIKNAVENYRYTKTQEGKDAGYDSTGYQYRSIFSFLEGGVPLFHDDSYVEANFKRSKRWK